MELGPIGSQLSLHISAVSQAYSHIHHMPNSLIMQPSRNCCAQAHRETEAHMEHYFELQCMHNGLSYPLSNNTPRVFSFHVMRILVLQKKCLLGCKAMCLGPMLLNFTLNLFIYLQAAYMTVWYSCCFKKVFRFCLTPWISFSHYLSSYHSDSAVSFL